MCITYSLYDIRENISKGVLVSKYYEIEPILKSLSYGFDFHVDGEGVFCDLLL